MAIREIKLPKGFLETLSDKCRKELEEKALKFVNEQILDKHELRELDYEMHSSYNRVVSQNYPYREYPKTLDRMGNLLSKVQYEGFKLVEEKHDTTHEELLKLKKDSQELKTLKDSIAQIKQVIK